MRKGVPGVQRGNSRLWRTHARESICSSVACVALQQFATV